MVPLLLCVALLFAPALAARVNRNEARASAGSQRLSAVGLDRPSDDRASRSAARGAAPVVAAAITVPPVVPSTTPASPRVTTTTHVHAVATAKKVAGAVTGATTTTHTHAPTTTTTHTHAKTTTTHTHAPTTTTTKPAPTTTTTTAPPNEQRGKASWYVLGTEGNCAHRTLPKGTSVKVTNVANGLAMTCRIADRGPYVDGRVIDLAKVDFERLAGSHEGVIDVIIVW